MPENVKLSRYFHSIDYCSLFISIDTKKLGLIGIIPLRGKRWGGGGGGKVSLLPILFL